MDPEPRRPKAWSLSRLSRVTHLQVQHLHGPVHCMVNGMAGAPWHGQMNRTVNGTVRIAQQH
eukprot:scaffold320106_cov23-Tisochrysis_lutea.AAC.2